MQFVEPLTVRDCPVSLQLVPPLAMLPVDPTLGAGTGGERIADGDAPSVALGVMVNVPLLTIALAPLATIPVSSAVMLMVPLVVPGHPTSRRRSRCFHR